MRWRIGRRRISQIGNNAPSAISHVVNSQSVIVIFIFIAFELVVDRDALYCVTMVSTVHASQQVCDGARREVADYRHLIRSTEKIRIHLQAPSGATEWGNARTGDLETKYGKETSRCCDTRWKGTSSLNSCRSVFMTITGLLTRLLYRPSLINCFTPG